MTNRQWLKQEINQWVDDGVITDEEGKELSARYKHAGPYPYREAFFFLAAVCILGGLFFLGGRALERADAGSAFPSCNGTASCFFSSDAGCGSCG